MSPIPQMNSTQVEAPARETAEDMLILRLMDGRRVHGSLAAPFAPNENRITVTSENEGKVDVYSLAEVCLIYLRKFPGECPKGGGATEQVELLTGESLKVGVPYPQEYDTGFFGALDEAPDSARCVFFTFAGIRSRRRLNPLGEILEESGAVSRNDLDSALGEQKRHQERRIGELVAEKYDVPQETIDATIQRMLRSDKVPGRARIGDILVSAGLVTKEQIDEVLVQQNRNKKKQLGALLVERGFVTENQVLAALCSKFRLEFIDLEKIEPDTKALNAISYDVIQQFQVFPVADKGDHIVVATSNPVEHGIIGVSLRFHANRRVEMVVAASDQISAAIEKYYPHGTEQNVGDIFDEMFDDEDVAVDDGRKEANEPLITESDSKIIRTVNKILLDGHFRKASDIHVEPGAGREPVQVRYRVDGICQESHKIPHVYKKALISRLKILANLDITERRKPQSGKIITRLRKQKVEFRLEITPTVGEQEDAVIRVLSSSKPLPFEKLNFSASNIKRFRQILDRPFGIILCVGPTGSGKTTTLHSALSYLNTPGRKIWTAEDPVEITQSGLRQVQILPKIGFTFEEALRSFLRADPDIIMIGEIRDRETAKIAVEASLTGHLVLSTLHTNSAPETVVRLVEMGVEAYNFADALLGVLAQRLARRLCPGCRERYQPDPASFDELQEAYDPIYYREDNLPSYSEKFTLFRARGCNECGNTGYSGRIAVHELLLGSPAVKMSIKQQETAEKIRGIGIMEGMRTLRMDGIAKVLQGLTDYEQTRRVCA